MNGLYSSVNHWWCLLLDIQYTRLQEKSSATTGIYYHQYGWRWKFCCAVELLMTNCNETVGQSPQKSHRWFSEQAHKYQLPLKVQWKVPSEIPYKWPVAPPVTRVHIIGVGINMVLLHGYAIMDVHGYQLVQLYITSTLVISGDHWECCHMP